MHPSSMAASSCPSYGLPLFTSRVTIVSSRSSSIQIMVDTSRLEAFSDGVFAVAITLLVFDLNAASGSGSLAHRLLTQWPSYAAFLVSFATIGIIWLNHHDIFRTIRAADHGLIVANLALLLVVTAFPFPTKIVAQAFEVSGTAADRRTAALFYGGWNVAFTVAINVLWWQAARGRRLIEPETPQATVDARTRLALLGLPTYMATTLLALVSPEVSVGLDGLLALGFLFPTTWIERLLTPASHVSTPQSLDKTPPLTRPSGDAESLDRR